MKEQSKVKDDVDAIQAMQFIYAIYADNLKGCAQQ
jgi:hypothetical protein